MIQNELDIDYHIYKTYQIAGLLGKGAYGQVYKAKNKKSSEIFAIKKICDAYQNITDAKRTYRQLNYLFQLSHPCIVKLYQVIPGYRKNAGLIRQSNTSRTNFVNGMYDNHQIGYNTQKTHDGCQQYNSKLSKHVYALFQYVETDLSKALRRCVMQPIQRKYIAYQILQGISYLHRSKLIHRDVKPSNILIDVNCDIKICDFGLCRIKQQKSNPQYAQQNIITEYVASRWYRPPQILLGFSPCNEGIDIWGVGCVIAQLILRNPLFQGESTMDQLQKIFRIIGLPSEVQINKLQSDQAKFLLRTFTFSRKNKPQKIGEVLSQASDQQLDLIQKLLKFNPEDRLSAEQALKHRYFSEMEQMNYNFHKYNIPVKIIDHTDSSFSLGDFKNVGNQYQQKLQIVEKNQTKKKQITLQHYQTLIQDLERATSRSSNRFYNQRYLDGPDKVVDFNQNNIDEQQISKQKSTRQSNFLLQHRNLIQKTQKKQDIQLNSKHAPPKQTQKILENYNKQKSCSSSHKNLKISELVSRNVHSTMDNYFNDSNPQFNHQGNNLLLSSQANHNMQIASKCNENIQNNLEQTYGIFFDPFQKQYNKKPINLTKKNIQNLSTLQDISLKKKIPRKVSNNKSHSKLSSDTLKDKSSAKNKSKHIHSQFSDELNNKYSSYTTLNINESNHLTELKGKIPLYKKPKDLVKNPGKLVKEFSKGKIGSEQKIQKNLVNKNHLKSSQNFNLIEIQKLQKQRKKSKDFLLQKQGEFKEEFKKTIEYSTEDNNLSKNFFAKINLKERQGKQQIESKSSQQIKKKTLQKKGQKNNKSKSLGKKKSQPKISSNK